MGNPDGRRGTAAPEPPPLRIRWDRIRGLVLCSTLTVLLLVVGFRGGTPNSTAAAGAAGAAGAATQRRAPTTQFPAPRTQDTCSASRAGRILHQTSGGTSGRTVALTFDDGPGAYTSDLLDILAREHVHASFFVIGRELAAHPDTARATAAGGHLLGDHSWSHPTIPASTGWPAIEVREQIARTEHHLRRATGAVTCFFRPPGGIVDGAISEARSQGMALALWSVDTKDWQRTRSLSLTDRTASILSNARVGLHQQHPVLLLHDGGGDRSATLAAVPQIIAMYRSEGYRFIRMDGAS